MNHGLKLHPDGTVEITMPKGKKVGRVLVCEAGTQNGSLYYPDGVETEITRCKDCKRYNGRLCGVVDFYNTANDYCSRAERRTDE